MSTDKLYFIQKYDRNWVRFYGVFAMDKLIKESFIPEGKIRVVTSPNGKIELQQSIDGVNFISMSGF